VSKLVIDENRCKGCALCVAACPKQLLRLSKRMNQYGFPAAEMIPDGEVACTSCALCAQMCPDVAITVYREEKGWEHE